MSRSANGVLTYHKVFMSIFALTKPLFFWKFWQSPFARKKLNGRGLFTNIVKHPQNTISTRLRRTVAFVFICSSPWAAGVSFHRLITSRKEIKANAWHIYPTFFFFDWWSTTQFTNHFIKKRSSAHMQWCYLVKTS